MRIRMALRMSPRRARLSPRIRLKKEAAKKPGKVWPLLADEHELI